MMENIVFNDKYSPITADELSRIPEEMKKEPRWICWGSDKVPVSVTAGKNGNHFGIDVTKPDNWGTFEQATAAIGQISFVKYADEYFHVVGIGFVVGDGWFCADLDGGAAHKKEDVPEEPIISAVINMHPYIEKSLSGCGYHIFGKCDFDTTTAENNKPHRTPDGEPVPESYEIEFFTRRKFIAITGRIVETKKYCSNTHINTAFDGISGARTFYEQWILTDHQRDEEKRAAERAKITTSAPTSADDAAEMFRMNYPEILAASDSSNFRRGGPGVKLGPGEYSWIGAVKAMQEIGIPEPDIMEWCRRGSNFKSEKDVQKVLNKSGKTGAASVAGIIADAKAHGWKPDPEKLTGEFKKNHEQAEYERKQRQQYREAHREEHAAQLAALGIDCGGDPYKFTWTLNFDGSISEVIEKETGEIRYRNPVRPPDPVQPIPGKTVHTVPAAVDPAEPWEPIEKMPPLPVFPLDRFPGWIQDYIHNFTATTGVNPDFCAAAVIAAVSAVVVGHCDVLFNNHLEPAQLYSAFVGGSGSMKSSVISQFIKPVHKRLRVLNDIVKKDNFAASQRIEEIEYQISQEKKKTKQDVDKLHKLAAQIEQEREGKRNSYPVPLDDVTPEALVSSMRFTRGTANIASAEGNIINVITGHSYTQRGATPNLDVFLKGFDGEPIHGYRVTTGEMDIERADISILLAIQPGLLERLLKSGDAVGRGLAQRFILYAPAVTESEIDHTQAVEMDPVHEQKWAEHLRGIATSFMEPDEPAKVMKLDPAADMIIRKFWNYETAMKKERGAADEDSIIGWISKLHGKALRLAAILALLRDWRAESISEQDAQTAVDLFTDYYIPQFIAAYEKPDNLTKAQRQIINWIVRRSEKTGKRDQFPERELWMDIRQRTAFQGKPGQLAFREAMADLRAKNFIRPIMAAPAPGGHKPVKAWQINPDLFTK